MRERLDSFGKSAYAVSNITYNGLNFLYLYFLQLEKGYTDGRWLTFKQAQDLGGGVKKGEKSAQIFDYREYDKNTKKDFDRKKIEELPKDEQLQYIKENVVPVLRYSNVFNAQQCENLPKVEKIAMTAQEIDAQRQAAMETVLKNNPVPITHDGGSRAYYSPREDATHLPEMAVFKDMQNYYATALHEIAHSTGHKSRLDRNLQTADKAAYAVEELRAELGCVFVQNELGIKIEGRHYENHAAYLQSWLNQVKKDPAIFLEAVSDAGKIADYITTNYAQEKAEEKQGTVKPYNFENIDAAHALDYERHVNRKEAKTNEAHGDITPTKEELLMDYDRKWQDLFDEKTWAEITAPNATTEENKILEKTEQITQPQAAVNQKLVKNAIKKKWVELDRAIGGYAETTNEFFEKISKLTGRLYLTIG